MTLVGIWMCFGLFTGCGSNSKQQQKEQEQVNLVGNDKDDHGCIASAGYQWSELLKDCIRPFEKGVKLAAVTEEYNGSAAYLVFNGDTTKVEVFMPKEKVRPILTLTKVDGQDADWKSAGEGKISIEYKAGKWNLLMEGTTIFTQE